MHVMFMSKQYTEQMGFAVTSNCIKVQVSTKLRQTSPKLKFSFKSSLYSNQYGKRNECSTTVKAQVTSEHPICTWCCADLT